MMKTDDQQGAVDLGAVKRTADQVAERDAQFEAAKAELEDAIGQITSGLGGVTSAELLMSIQDATKMALTDLFIDLTRAVSPEVDEKTLLQAATLFTTTYDLYQVASIDRRRNNSDEEVAGIVVEDGEEG